MRHGVFIVVLCCGLMTGPPTDAQVAVIIDQPPNQIAGTFSDEGYDAFLYLYGYSQSIADDFIVDTLGAGFVLDDITIWGGFEPYNGSTFPLWDDVDVLVRADVGGLPGTILCAEENVTATRTATGITFASTIDEYQVDLTLAAPCGLADGTYWIEIFYNTTVGFDDWVWEWGTVDAVSGRSGSAYAQENPGVAWDSIPSWDNAMVLSGTLGNTACVSTPSELQMALTAAGVSGQDTVIQIVQGTYVTPGQVFLYSTSESRDLEILGGYSPDCFDRVVDPTNTVLDGNDATAVLHIAQGPSTSGSIHVQGLTIRNGFTQDPAVAGLEISTFGDYGGRVTIDHNAFLDNHSGSGAGGLDVTVDNGLLSIVNNLLASNESGGGHGAGRVSCSGEATNIAFNTVADNTCSGCTGGLEVGGTVAPSIVNNILWGNDTVDLVFNNTATRLENNDIGSFLGSPDPGVSGANISIDPQFVGGGNYRLAFGSPATDAGTSTVPGGIPTTDLDNSPRVQLVHPDMGAYELPLIFFSTFENGTLDDWVVVNGGR